MARLRVFVQDATIQIEPYILDQTDANEFAAKLADATDRVVRDYGSEDVVHEEPFSDQLCGG